MAGANMDPIKAEMLHAFMMAAIEDFCANIDRLAAAAKECAKSIDALSEDWERKKSLRRHLLLLTAIEKKPSNGNQKEADENH